MVGIDEVSTRRMRMLLRGPVSKPALETTAIPGKKMPSATDFAVQAIQMTRESTLQLVHDPTEERVPL